MGGWPVGYLHNTVEELHLGLPRTNPDSSRVEDLNQGPPHFKSSTLNHPAMLPPACYLASYICISLILRTWWQFQVPIQRKVAYEHRFLAFFSHHGKTLFGREKQKPEICLYSQISGLPQNFVAILCDLSHSLLFICSSIQWQAFH